MADAHNYDEMSIEELEDLSRSYDAEVRAVKTEWRKLVAILDAKRAAAQEAVRGDGEPPSRARATGWRSSEWGATWRATRR